MYNLWCDVREKAIIPLAESGTAYLTYAIQLLPNGLRGFFLAAILATILSTLDSYLFLAGATVGHDLPSKKHQGKKRFIMLGTIASAGLAYILAIYFKGDIKTVWKTLGSYFCSLPFNSRYFRSSSKQPYI